MNDKDFSFPTDAKRVVPSAGEDGDPAADAQPPRDAKESGDRGKAKVRRTRHEGRPACGCQTNWRMAWVFLLVYLMSMVAIVIIMNNATSSMQQSLTKSADANRVAVENLNAQVKDNRESNREIIAAFIAAVNKIAEGQDKIAEGQDKMYTAFLEAARRPAGPAAQPAHAKLTGAEKERVNAALHKVIGRRADVNKIRTMIRSNADRDDVITALHDLSDKLGTKSPRPLGQAVAALESSQAPTGRNDRSGRVWPRRRGKSGDTSAE